jgi:hypothetical protein
MNAFKDFGITATVKSFTGDKIKMNKILNKQIQVLAFKIDASKYTEKGNGKCLHLQIKIGDVQHIVFTGSATLMDMIAKVPAGKFPFNTTIIEENERYEFT